MGFFSSILGGPTRQRPEPLKHRALGELVWNEDGWWEGGVDHEGTRIEVSVVGDEAGPHPDVATAAVATLSRLGEISHRAIRFLLADLTGPGTPMDCPQFNLTGVCHLWANRPQDFWLTFELQGDLGAIWRVEFEDGNPKYSGRDD